MTTPTRPNPPINSGPRIACLLCGLVQYAEALIYSRHTDTHYCADFNACDVRRGVITRSAA